MGENSEGPAMNIVLPDGKCKKCLKKVDGYHVTCIVCKSKFHAAGCSNDIDICTRSFVDVFRPFSEKTGLKYAARPGNFHFICDPCLTRFEMEQTSSQDDKVDHLKTKVDNLENGLTEIKNLLLGNQNCSHVNGTHPVVTAKENAWHLNNRFAPIDFPDDDDVETVRDGFSDTSASTVILPAVEDKALEKTRMKAISKAAMQSKVSISKSYRKQNGETVIICDSSETMNTFKSNIENAVPDIALKSPDIRKCSVGVVGFDDNWSSSDLIDALIEQNFFMKAFFSVNSIDDHMKYFGTKPLKKDSERFQAEFRISRQLRQLIFKHNDRLIVGILSCKVYDRTFVKRCALCQKFGHFVAQCPNPEEPKCAKCGEDHETKNCNVTDEASYQCINCKRAGLDSTNHACFSHLCPVFIEELTKAKARNLNMMN